MHHPTVIIPSQTTGQLNLVRFGFADEIAVCILVVAVILDDFGRKFFRDVHLFNSGLDAFLNGSRLNDRLQCLLRCGA